MAASLTTAAPVVDQKQQNKINMRDVGNFSYNLLGAPELSNTEKFKAACLHRSRFHRDDPGPSGYLDLCASPDQERLIFNVTAREYTIGAMLDGAIDINVGKGLSQRKLNLLGENEGMACVSNTPDRLRRLRQSSTLSASIEALKLSRMQAKKSRAAVKASKAALVSTTSATELPIVALLTEESILPWGPAGKQTSKITIPPLKAYLKRHKLTKLLPNVPHKDNRPNLMVFFSELCIEVTHT